MARHWSDSLFENLLPLIQIEVKQLKDHNVLSNLGGHTPQRIHPDSSTCCIMCVRYACTCDHELIERTLGIPSINTEKEHPRENVGPRSYNPIVRLDSDQLTLDYLEWGLNPSAKVSTFNCRIESIRELKPTWKCAKTKRAVAIMNGYYEWQHKAVDKIPYYFHTGQDVSMALAIWDNDCYSIVTKNATKKLSKIHPRMPILVDFEIAQKWIKGDWPDVLDLVNNGIEPEFYQVSQQVNKIGNQGPQLLKKVKSMDLRAWAHSGKKPLKKHDNDFSKTAAKDFEKDSSNQRGDPDYTAHKKRRAEGDQVEFGSKQQRS